MVTTDGYHRALLESDSGLLNCAIASDLDPPSRSFQQFCLKVGVAYFSGLLYKVQAIESRMTLPMTSRNL